MDGLFIKKMENGEYYMKESHVSFQDLMVSLVTLKKGNLSIRKEINMAFLQYGKKLQKLFVIL